MKPVIVVRLQEIANLPDGEALASDQMPLSPGATEDARVADGGFAIDTLPPGDVVMRALVTVDGKLVDRAVRTLRKK